MREVYGLYLFFKNFTPDFFNKLIYLWSRIGKIILGMGRLFSHPSRENVKEIFCITEAYVYCLKHKREIKSGNLEFYNRSLH